MNETPFIFTLKDSRENVKAILKDSGIKPIAKAFTYPEFTIKELKRNLPDLSYRTINHWDSFGLLTSTQKGKGWRKFSIADWVWVELIDLLRQFGVDLETVAKARPQLIPAGTNKSNFLAFLIYASAGIPVYVILLPNGKANFCLEGELFISEYFGTFGKAYIKIDFIEVVQGVLGINIERQGIESPRLTKREKEIVRSLKTEGTSRLEVEYKDKLPARMAHYIDGDQNELVAHAARNNILNYTMQTKARNGAPVKSTLMHRIDLDKLA